MNSELKCSRAPSRMLSKQARLPISFGHECAQEILSKYLRVVASRGLSVDSERGVEGSSKRTASPPLYLFIKRV